MSNMLTKVPLAALPLLQFTMLTKVQQPRICLMVSVDVDVLLQYMHIIREEQNIPTHTNILHLQQSTPEVLHM